MAGAASGGLSFTYNLCRLGDLTWEMPQLRTAGQRYAPFTDKGQKEGCSFSFSILCAIALSPLHTAFCSSTRWSQHDCMVRRLHA